MRTRVVFERIVAGAIIGNASLLLAGLALDGYEEWFELAHDGILGIFALELAVRLRVGGWGFLRRPLNVLDAAVIAVSFLPVLSVDAGLLRLVRAARLLHLAKHVAPHLRLTNFVPAGRLVPVAVAVVGRLPARCPSLVHPADAEEIALVASSVRCRLAGWAGRP